MLLVMTFAHPATDLLHQHGFVVEMLSHQPLQPCQVRFKLDRLAVDRPEPPICDREMVSIDSVMAERMLWPDERTNAPDRHVALSYRRISVAHAPTTLPFDRSDPLNLFTKIARARLTLVKPG